MNFLWKHRDVAYGCAGGFKLWTGQTQGIPTSVDKYFPLTGQYGSRHSNGILYLSGIRGRLKVSAGWDSEKVRDFIQNNYHRLRGIGIIAPLDDRESRFYLQLSLNAFSTLY
jgi:hypothetical protein